MLIAVGAALGIADPSTGGGTHAESPGQAAATLSCPAGDKEVVGEAVYPATPPPSTLTPREALRQFLRAHFRALLALKFATVASPAAKIQLAARLDGHRVASVLLTRTANGGVRPEGASVCQSVLQGR